MNHKDLRGTIIQQGDAIMYGKSDRYNPVNVGIVQEVTSEGITVLGRGNTKTGDISRGNTKSRVLVLPEGYLEDVF